MILCCDQAEESSRVAEEKKKCWKHWKLWVVSPAASFVSWPCSRGTWAILGRKTVKGWMD